MRRSDYWTDLPRPRFELKAEPEDFCVEEILLPSPASVCKHPGYMMFRLEKRSLSTGAVVRDLAARWNVRVMDIKMAGQKDVHALTRQNLTVPLSNWKALPPHIELSRGVYSVEAVGPVADPLKLGAIQGNRFRIKMGATEAVDDLIGRWQAAREVTGGFANYFGNQRFGLDDQVWQDGLEQLRKPPSHSKRRLWPRNWAISALQSHLFNLYLERRIALGKWEQLLPGEPGPYPEGPIWGYKLPARSGVARQAEERVLKDFQIRASQFAKFRAPGSRRRLKIPIPELSVENQMLCFDLPSGSYATVLLDHFFECFQAHHEVLALQADDSSILEDDR